MAATQPPLDCNKENIESAAKFHGHEIAPDIEFLTITVINNQSVPISTSHAHDPSGPSAVSGSTGPGTLAASAAFAVPTGWIRNIAINDAKWAIIGDDFLIEANFVIPQGFSITVADVDVSYV